MQDRYEFIIDGEGYLVRAQEVATVERRIMDAVDAGGAFVDLPSAGPTRRRVLITAATSVVLDHVRIDDPERN